MGIAFSIFLQKKLTNERLKNAINSNPMSIKYIKSNHEKYEEFAKQAILSSGLSIMHIDKNVLNSISIQNQKLTLKDNNFNSV